MEYLNTNKLNKIKLKTDNMYVVIDFDKTITGRESVDSWDSAGFLLENGFKEKSQKLYQKYRPIELDYKITFEEKTKAMEEWYNGCLNLYYEYHLTKQQLEKAVSESGLIFRKGAKKFLIEMHKNNVPVIILSAGIGNVIEIYLKENNCYFKNMHIISNFLEFDENGNIKPIKTELIHTMNKTLEGHVPSEFENEIKKRKYRLLFGDTIEDKKMIKEEEHENTILVGFLNNNIEENLEKYKSEFDICCVGDVGFPEMEKIL